MPGTVLGSDYATEQNGTLSSHKTYMSQKLFWLWTYHLKLN